MNSPGSLLEGQGELVKNKEIFPLDFATTGPLCVSDRLSMTILEKKAKLVNSLNEIYDYKYIDAMIPNMSQLWDCQIDDSLFDLRNNPRNVYLLTNVGSAYLNRGKIAEAITYFENALEIHADFILAQLNLAKAYMLQSRYEDALRVYISAEKVNPSNTKILMNIAHAYIRLEKLDLASEIIERIIKLEPSNFAGHYNKGLIRLMKGRIEEAISSFRKSILLNDKFTDGYNALGICFAIKLNYRKSIKYLLTAVVVSKSAPSVILNLANVYQLASEYENSITLLEKLLDKYPNNFNARDRLAFAYFRLGKTERSLINLRYLIYERNNSLLDSNLLASIFNNIGVVYENTDRFTDAEVMYRKALDTANKPDPITYFNLSKLYIVLDRKQKAKALIDEYSSAVPGDDRPLLLLALYHYNQSEYAEAKELLLRLVDNNSCTREVFSFLSSIYADVFENLEAAKEITLKGLDLYPHDESILNNLAYVYLCQGLIDDARNILNRINWENAPFYLNATKGLLKLMEGNLTEGRALYDKAVHLAPIADWKLLVRQKQRIEIARYSLSKGDVKDAVKQLTIAKTIKTSSKIYWGEIDRLYHQAIS